MARSCSFTKAYCLAFLLLLPACAYAAVDPANDLNVPLVRFGFALLLGAWGAACSLLQRYSTEGFPEGKGYAIVVSEMMNATLASMITLLVCLHFEIKPSLTSIACCLAGFGGGRFMTKVYLKFEAKAEKAV